jgi:hypothetical protein
VLSSVLLYHDRSRSRPLTFPPIADTLQTFGHILLRWQSDDFLDAEYCRMNMHHTLPFGCDMSCSHVANENREVSSISMFSQVIDKVGDMNKTHLQRQISGLVV